MLLGATKVRSHDSCLNLSERIMDDEALRHEYFKDVYILDLD